MALLAGLRDRGRIRAYGSDHWNLDCDWLRLAPLLGPDQVPARDVVKKPPRASLGARREQQRRRRARAVHVEHEEARVRPRVAAVLENFEARRREQRQPPDLSRARVVARVSLRACPLRV